MRGFLNHIELWLSAAGVAVILLVPGLMGVTPADYWRLTAYTAIAVGVLHGIIFWVVRRRHVTCGTGRCRRRTPCSATASRSRSPPC